MSNNSTFTPREPLSVTKVISAGLRIYGDRFISYYSLAFQAYLWLSIPIYGWAKFVTISGMLSRLAYKEVRETPETVREARSHVNPRICNFFLTHLLINLILFSAMILLAICVSMLGSLLQQTTQLTVKQVTFAIIIMIVFLFMVGFFWFCFGSSIFEVVIAVENIKKPFLALRRSLHLTKKYVSKILIIDLNAHLITIPVNIIVIIFIVVAQIIVNMILPTESGIFELISSGLSLIILSAGLALFLPFFQAIKGVIYYDLCSRKGEFN